MTAQKDFSIDSAAATPTEAVESEQGTQLFAEAKLIFDQLAQSPKGGVAMWIPSTQLASELLAGVAIAATGATSAQAADKYVAGVCEFVQQDGAAPIYPATDGDTYLFDNRRSDPRFSEKLTVGQFFKAANVTLLKAPSHGQFALSNRANALEDNLYVYTPALGYIGQDRFAIKLEKGDVTLRLEYVIEVLKKDWPSLGVCEPGHWLISGAQTVDSFTLSPLVAAAGISSALTVSGTQLAGSELAQASDGSVTLDFDGAGHGWYLDPPPLDNTDDFLPTADKTIWRAKAGSAADGKMDLLSVLLHEYGHVLGLAGFGVRGSGSSLKSEPLT